MLSPSTRRPATLGTEWRKAMQSCFVFRRTHDGMQRVATYLMCRGIVFGWLVAAPSEPGSKVLIKGLRREYIGTIYRGYAGII